jgi:hypothetical protein
LLLHSRTYYGRVAIRTEIVKRKTGQKYFMYCVRNHVVYDDLEEHTASIFYPEDGGSAIL